MIVLGARELEAEVLGDMLAHRAALTRRVPLLDQAIEDLKRASSGRLWADSLHLAPAVGNNAFTANRAALSSLGMLSRQSGHPIPAAVLQGWQSRLAKVERILAYVEISRDTYAGVNRLALFKIWGEFSRGDQDAGATRYASAFEHYVTAYTMAASVWKLRVPLVW